MRSGNYEFLRIERRIITPQIAEELLKTNVDNRPRNLNRVHYFMKILESGKWDKEDSSLQIQDDGKLLDGQHRLTAIMRTGKTVESQVIVVRKLDD